MAADGYAWWIERLPRRAARWSTSCASTTSAASTRYWEIPAGEPTTAVNGRWVPGPGAGLLRRAAQTRWATLPIIAEDLGVITPEVDALRDGFGLPGMQRPAVRLRRRRRATASCRTTTRANCVVYTGTHDNDTTVRLVRARARRRRARLRAAATWPRGGDDIAWDLIRGGLGVGRRHRDRPAAGRARAGQRGAHEHARPAGRQLELAPARRRARPLAGRTAGRHDGVLRRAWPRLACPPPPPPPLASMAHGHGLHGFMATWPWLHVAPWPWLLLLSLLPSPPPMAGGADQVPGDVVAAARQVVLHVRALGGGGGGEPADGGVVVVRAGVDDAVRRVVVRQEAVAGVGVEGELQHAHAGQTELIAQRVDRPA